MIKDRIAATAALAAFALAGLAGVSLAGLANADTGTSSAASPSSETTSSTAPGTDSSQSPTRVTIKQILTDVVQLNQKVASTAQQNAESLAETNARLNAKSSVVSSVPVVAISRDDGGPSSAPSRNSSFSNQADTSATSAGLEADAAKP